MNEFAGYPTQGSAFTFMSCLFFHPRLQVLALALATMCVCTSASVAQVYEKVFSFTDARITDIANSPNKGAIPEAGLVQGSDGNFYGTTRTGGASNFGTVFQMTSAGVLTTLIEFTNNAATNKGREPSASLVQGSDGNFYGTTTLGGASDFGTVFKMTPAGVLTTLVQFTNNGATNKGSYPYAGLVQASDGNFYGTTKTGGAGSFGTVFKMTPAGVLTTLVEFTNNGAANKGRHPYAGLIQGSDGNFYGTTFSGGAHGFGTVFKMTPAGMLTTLVEFTDKGTTNKGRDVYAGLVQGTDGNFYGTTRDGGTAGNGTVFKMTPAGVLTTLVEFTSIGAINRGGGPYAGLVQASNGNFYGTTSYGAMTGIGTVFQMTTDGMLTTLIEFTGNAAANKGGAPFAGLVQASDGNFYGTTTSGGATGSGTVFQMLPAGGLTTLVEFTGNAATNKGNGPRGGLAQGNDGNFYGTTSFGGASGYGTVFQMTPAGGLTTLVEFSGNGGVPYAGLVQGSDGNFYGTTFSGGASSSGSVFKMTAGGVLTILVEFTNNGASNKGARPYAGLVQDNVGNFYGTTREGGASGIGTVFKMTATGELTTLVEFTGNGASNKGGRPESGLVQGSDGDFYGTTRGGGATDDGTVFKMTPAGVLTTLVEFTGSGGANKGSSPRSLVQGSDGNFYGCSSGTVFKMTPAGVLTTLIEFTGNGATNKGSSPEAALVQGSDGNFYGTTRLGGASNTGTAFKITPSGLLTTLVEFPSIEDGYPMAALIPGADGNLYGTTYGPNGTIYRLIIPGTATMLVANAKLIGGSASAVVEAQVNARGAATTVTVEYGTDGLNFPNALPVAANLNGFQTRLVGTTLTGLVPGTTYFFRFCAVSTAGTTLTPVQSFSTLAEPLVTPTPATELAPSSARFNGTVNARNYDTTVRFEWGTNGNSFPNTVNATPVTVVGNTDVSVSAAVAGLVKGTTYYYRIVATNAGGTTVSGTQSFRTLTEPTAGIGGNFALTTTSVRVEGSVNAQGSDSSVVFEYGTDGVSFPNSVAATPGTVTGNGSTTVSAVLTTLSQGATYHYRIKATSAGGVGTSSSASFSMNVLSGFAQVFPNAPPESEGFLTVNLTPTGILHGWRFIGEQQWRASGVAGGLATGDYTLEFRPVPGWNHPPEEVVSVVSGETTSFTADYYHAAATSGTGGLSVLLKPDSIISGVNRAQWRLLGENDTQWRDSGATITDLIPGNYLVECKPVAGRETPPNVNVAVTTGQTASPTITYFVASAATGAAPSVLAFESVSGDATRPYGFVGQIRSNAGVGSGFAVKQRVVATAAHVVWNDGTLSAAQGLQWLFQRHRGQYEPPPILPRGFYLFDSYSGQRATEAAPGFFSPQSQTLDVAALYFTENAARGGHGGFLASDLAQNEFLLSNANKLLVGYPVDGIAVGSQGRMHATSPANVSFTAGFGRTFTTTALRAIGGNSGGPLCVQFEGGNYYPAAICLGGSGQMVVRAIDSAAVDLFNRAETSGNGGGGVVSSGATLTTLSTGGTTGTGSLRVIILPTEAGGTFQNPIARWSLSPQEPFRPTGQTLSLNTGKFIVKLSTIPGFQVPAEQEVTISPNTTNTLTVTYQTNQTSQESWRQTYFGTTSNTGNAADAFDYDGDGFTNAQEYAAGTNPTLSGDFFKVTDSQRTESTFTASTAGKAGRTYTLQRSTNLNSWIAVGSPQGPLVSDGAVTLQDAAMPNDAAFYRIVVTGP